MLLFQAEHLQPVYIGLKTETRRLWKEQRAREGSIHRIKTKIFSKKHHGFIRILEVWKENLLDITEKGAYNEGGYSKETYLKKWFEINPSSPENPEVFVIQFQFLYLKEPPQNKDVAIHPGPKGGIIRTKISMKHRYGVCAARVRAGIEPVMFKSAKTLGQAIGTMEVMIGGFGKRELFYVMLNQETGESVCVDGDV